ncbi:alpha-mannosidase 2-like protein [Dinothrombium tinctorium]|uniref:Alpha-mannosidase n=1 Tax=Dinothrombium tinctorium TaxID=1965070 RepID=A0A443RR49_9ACAR|nr:alpha-mannosidase 2-like protein [Dinothrombium tinctorium]
MNRVKFRRCFYFTFIIYVLSVFCYLVSIYLHDNDEVEIVSLKNERIEKFYQNLSNFSIDSEQQLIAVEHIYEELEFDNPYGGVWTQGWNLTVDESKFKSEKLKVFVVPHSHNDPGWLKTFDDYFENETKHILDNMLIALAENPKMTFIWDEISYFAEWWKSIKSEAKRKLVKKFLNNGQLEIVSGGWVMNDEANSHYFAIITQMIEGHQFLVDNLNYRPRYGWTIDPFGVSSSMSFLLKRMGFKAVVVQRIHYSIKKYLAGRKMLEFRWKQFWERESDKNDIIGHVEPFFSYDIPHTCGPDPHICCQFDFYRSGPMSCPWKTPPQMINEKNIEERAELLLDQYKKKSQLFRSNSLLVPLGDDFRYQKKSEWRMQYENYQKLFDYMNSKPELNVEIKFATLADYFRSLFASHPRQNFQSIIGDFFTYADRDDHYWSGYYTSRPFYKRFDRILESYLRASEIIFTLCLTSQTDKAALDKLSPYLIYARQNLALFQHHDAITGTARDHVVIDYAKRMLTSIKNAQKIIADSTSLLLNSLNSTKTIRLQFFENFIRADLIQSEDVLRLNENSTIASLVAYNSLVSARSEILCFRLESERNNWFIKDSNGHEINEVQFWSIGTDGANENVKEVCFLAKLKPLSLIQFTIETVRSKENNYQFSYDESYTYEDVSYFEISNELVKLTFSTNDGFLRKVVRNVNERGEETNVRIRFMTYGTDEYNGVQSGAYLFLPDYEEPEAIAFRDPAISVIRGDLISKVQTSFANPIFLKHNVFIVKGEDNFYVENIINLNADFFDNRELIMQLETNVNNGNEFYTDVNGLQMAKRKFYDKLPLQGNVYPMPTMMFIENNEIRLNVLTAQPLGVVNRKSGLIEVFLDRRLLQDDERGLPQGVTDNLKTSELFVVRIESKQNETRKVSIQSQLASLRLLNPVYLMFSKKQNDKSEISFMRSKLPCDVHLLNMRSKTPNLREFSVILHRFGVNYDSNCSSNESFKLSSLFSSKFARSINPIASHLSLSLLHLYKSNVSVFEDDQFIEQMDFNTYNIFMKENLK